MMEIGIDSFASNMASDGTGKAAHSVQVIQELLERIEKADEAGLDVFGIGEHHITARSFLIRHQLLYSRQPQPAPSAFD